MNFLFFSKLLPHIPEFSEKTLRKVSWISIIFIAVSGVFLVYEMFSTPDWTYDVEWNMFKSQLLSPLIIIGFIIAMVNFGKNHYSQDTYIETTYRNGSKKVEKSNDITDVLFGRVIMPFLGHFILEPLMWAAIIYYPLMCLLSIVSSVLPYIITLLIIGVCVGIWFYPKYCFFRYHSLAFVVFSFTLFTIFLFSAISLEKKKGNSGFTGSDIKTVRTSVNSEKGDLAALWLRGPVKRMVENNGYTEQLYEFAEDGHLTIYMGKRISEYFRCGIERNANDQITKGIISEDAETEQWTYDNQGQVITYLQTYMDGTDEASYSYNNEGYMISAKGVSTGMDVEDDGRWSATYTYPSKDEYGNWTVRISQHSNGETYKCTRKIIYYN